MLMTAPQQILLGVLAPDPDGKVASRTRRSVQAGVYPNVMVAAKNIVAAAGARGLFTGYLPTLLEDIPDMAFKFAAYESLRAAHLRLMRGRKASVQVWNWFPESVPVS